MTKDEDLKVWDKELGERLDDLMRVCKEYGTTAYRPMPRERRLCLESDLELQMWIIKSGILDRYTRPIVTPADGDAERVNAARKIVKEADDKSRQDKKLADAIQSIKWAMANTFVICTGATIEGVKHQVPDMREPLNLVLEAALQSTRKPPTKGE